MWASSHQLKIWIKKAELKGTPPWAKTLVFFGLWIWTETLAPLGSWACWNLDRNLYNQLSWYSGLQTKTETTQGPLGLELANCLSWDSIIMWANYFMINLSLSPSIYTYPTWSISLENTNTKLLHCWLWQWRKGPWTKECWQSWEFFPTVSRES